MIDMRLPLPMDLVLAALIVMASPTRIMAGTEETERARNFVTAHEAKLHPLERAANVAWWDANISGRDEDFARKIETQNRIDEALADREKFRALKEIKD